MKIINTIGAIILLVSLVGCGGSTNQPSSVAKSLSSQPLPANSSLTVQEESDRSITAIISDDKLNSVKDGKSSLFLRFYYDDSRKGGYEISSGSSNWSVNKIRDNSVLIEGNEIKKTGTKWKYHLSGNFVDDLKSCTYYEAIFKDWDNDANTGLFADGSFSVERNNNQPVPDTTSGNDASGIAQSTEQASGSYWFMDVKLPDRDGGWLRLHTLDGSGMPTKLSYSMYGKDYEFTLKDVRITVKGKVYTIEGTVCGFGRDKTDTPLYISASGDGGINETNNQFVMDSPAKQYYYVEGRKDRFLF